MMNDIDYGAVFGNLIIDMMEFMMKGHKTDGELPQHGPTPSTCLVGQVGMKRCREAICHRWFLSIRSQFTTAALPGVLERRFHICRELWTKHGTLQSKTVLMVLGFDRLPNAAQQPHIASVCTVSVSFDPVNGF